MPTDPAAEIRDGVRKLYEGSPIGRLGTMGEQLGGAVQDAGRAVSRAVEDTVQGTRRMVASKLASPAPARTADIPLPPASTPQGTTRGTTPKQTPKRLKKISVAQADNGGFIVSHHYQPGYGGTPAPEKHAFASYDDVHAHLEGVGAPKDEA